MNKLIGLLGFVAAYLSPGVIQAQVDLRDDGSTHSNIQYEFREHFVKQYKAAAAEFKFSG